MICLEWPPEYKICHLKKLPYHSYYHLMWKLHLARHELQFHKQKLSENQKRGVNYITIWKGSQNLKVPCLSWGRLSESASCLIPSSPSFSAVILRSTEVGVKARGVGEVVLGAGDIDPMLPIDTFGETDLQTKNYWHRFKRYKTWLG